MTSKKLWTKHKLKSDWLKALARAVNRLSDGKTGMVGSDGLGHGSASIRAALRNRGLIDDNDVITAAGIDAVASARLEGW